MMLVPWVNRFRLSLVRVLPQLAYYEVDQPWLFASNSIDQLENLLRRKLSAGMVENWLVNFKTNCFLKI